MRAFQSLNHKHFNKMMNFNNYSFNLLIKDILYKKITQKQLSNSIYNYSNVPRKYDGRL
jgi:hypothetical protein